MTLSPRSFQRLLAEGAQDSEEAIPALEKAYRSVLSTIGREAALAFERHSVAITAAAGDPPPFTTPDPDEIMPRGKIEEEVTRRTKAARARAMKAAAAPALREAGIAWDVGGVYSERLVKMAGARARNLERAAREVIRVAIADALTQGLSVPDTAALIRSGVREATPELATMLARTDLIGVQNGASVTAARQVYPDGDLVKTWLATEDERTRPSHADADGQSVPLEASFQVGDDLLDYPGDPDGSDEEVINCRCTVIYENAPAATVASGGRVNVFPAIHDEEDEMSVTETETPPGTAWRSVLAVEGHLTEDGRYVEPGAFRWRDLPLTLMGMVETTEGGHLGAQVAGRIDQIQRVGNDIVGAGEFDSAGEYGAEIERLVRDRTLRGVSVDPIVLESEYRLGSPSGPAVEGDALIEAMMNGEKIVWVYLDAVILGATVCPMQAIEGADIEVVASSGLPQPGPLMREFDPFGLDGVTASVAGLAPLEPPRSWFDDPKFTGPTPFTVDDDGRVFGHVALWGTCHVGEPRGPGTCLTPTSSPSDYAHFALGEIICEDGSRVAVGTIAMDGGHASMGIDPRDVLRHYDNTTTAAADVAVGEDGYGIWVAGAVRPDLPAARVRALRASKPSGDWRRVSGMLDLVAILAVNSPGYPVPRALVASIGADEEVVALVSAAMVGTRDEIQALASEVVREEIARVAATA